MARLVARVTTLDDHDAFAEIVHLYQTPVRRFLTRLAPASGAADDLAQETFLKAYRHLDSYRGQGRFVSWLFRIAYQEFVTSTRKRAPAATALDGDVVDAGLGERLVASLSIERAMTTLRSDERAALDLHYRRQLTHPEVANVMNVPIGTVKSLILRGRAKLRDVLVGRPAPETNR